MILALYGLSFPLLLWRCTNTGDIGKGAKRKAVDYAAFTDLPFWGFILVTFVQIMASLVPFFLMPTFAAVQLNTTRSVGLYTLITSPAASVPGRLIFATAAYQYGIMICWTVSLGCSAVVCFVWTAINSVPGSFAFCALYGKKYSSCC